MISQKSQAKILEIVLSAICGGIASLMILYATQKCIFCQQGGLSNYDVRFKTSSLQDAGTDSIVTLMIQDDKGVRQSFTFDGGIGEKDKIFEKGASEKYLLQGIQVEEIVRAALQISVRGEKSGWAPEYLEVVNETKEATYCMRLTQKVPKGFLTASNSIADSADGELLIEKGKCL